MAIPHSWWRGSGAVIWQREGLQEQKQTWSQAGAPLWTEPGPGAEVVTLRVSEQGRRPGIGPSSQTLVPEPRERHSLRVASVPRVPIWLCPSKLQDHPYPGGLSSPQAQRRLLNGLLVVPGILASKSCPLGSALPSPEPLGGPPDGNLVLAVRSAGHPASPPETHTCPGKCSYFSSAATELK